MARIKRITFNSIQIEDMEIDFLNNKCSFSIKESMGTQYESTLEYILRGFFIQYHEQGYGFFTFKKPGR